MPDKVIVITGANGGLGRALAQRFARDGDRVVLLGRTLSKVEEVAKEIGERAIIVWGSVRDEAAQARMHRRAWTLASSRWRSDCWSLFIKAGDPPRAIRTMSPWGVRSRRASALARRRQAARSRVCAH